MGLHNRWVHVSCRGDILFVALSLAFAMKRIMALSVMLKKIKLLHHLLCNLIPFFVVLALLPLLRTGFGIKFIARSQSAKDRYKVLLCPSQTYFFAFGSSTHKFLVYIFIYIIFVLPLLAELLEFVSLSC